MPWRYLVRVPLGGFATALGKRKRQQQDTFWVGADKLGGGPRNAFYDLLNQLLDDIEFDSNKDWASETDPDSRIGKMKDGRFHLKYKAENAVDLETEIIVAAEVYHGDVGDTKTIVDTVNTAKTNLRESNTGCEVKEVVGCSDFAANASNEHSLTCVTREDRVEPGFVVSRRSASDTCQQRWR